MFFIEFCFHIGLVTTTATDIASTEGITIKVTNSVTTTREESGNSSVLIGTILAAILFTLLATFIVVFIKRRRASKKGMVTQLPIVHITNALINGPTTFQVAH